MRALLFVCLEGVFHIGNWFLWPSSLDSRMHVYWYYFVVLWCASSWYNYCVLLIKQSVTVKGVIITVSESGLLTYVHVLYRHQCTCIILCSVAY